ncbi:MAG: RluA family pseudouridine synthase [Planctomycetaceae bacterium]|nr:RluA family pseudouridine synthase [Planctomycetaceae bacterium]
MSSPLTVLYEDNHCLAVVKPARVLVAGDRTGDESLLEQAKAYLKAKYQKPHAVYLGLVHRLDRPVSGVVLFARTSKAAARLSDQFRQGTITKLYQALVEGRVVPAEGELCDWLLKDEATNTVRTVAPETAGAKSSRLCYRTLETGRNLTLVEVQPLTGRSHQIRVQLATAGHPIYGDGKYGSQNSGGGEIALHAAALTFAHPTSHEPITIAAAVPADWRTLLRTI